MLKALIVLLIIEELVSITIYCIMKLYNGFDDVIPDMVKDYYGEKRRPKLDSLFTMAFAGGWLFAPYFIYLAYSWIKERKKTK